MAVDRALATVREAPFIVDVFRAADDLALAAARGGGRRAAETLTRAVHDPADELTAIAAVHALGRVFDDEADAVLSDLLSHQRAFLREHAAWTLGARLPRLDAIGRLVAVVTAGGFSGMLAQRTLAHWARSASDHVALALEGAIAAGHQTMVRARLVETLGLVPGELACRAVLRIGADPEEPEPVRVAAVAALGDRGGERDAVAVCALVRRLAGEGGEGGEGGELGAVAALAAVDLRRALPRQDAPAPPRPADGSRLNVAQLFLHADIDESLTRSGTGDNGGVATLLLRLGASLAAEPQVGRVLTLSRGSAEVSAAALASQLDGQLARPGGAGSDEGEHLLAAVPLLRAPTGATEAWPARVAAERGIRRALIAYGPIDVLHLRMADVGSLAAAAVAADLDIPVVFTLAPDPHAMIHSLDMAGALSRGSFGSADEREHFWFRARLVQRLAAEAAHDVLFPRPELLHDLHELLGVDVAAEPHRYTVVPEGVDLTVTRSARADVERAAAGARVPALDDLAALLAALPESRRGLPLALSVGRLHPVKGMAAVVGAWAGDAQLRARCNLLIVGGDLADPSPVELEQLQLIRSVLAEKLAGDPDAAAGALLVGHRPNDDVARWLGAARLGLPPEVPTGGIYVCGSLKEEFGLAVLEAMAAGLTVVAPDGGGPATYVEPGVTGLLVNTLDPGELAAGMRSALDLAARRSRGPRPGPADDLIDESLTVQAMARSLAGLYAGVRQPVTR